MSSDILVALAAALLSLGFSYIPGLADWYAKLTAEYKRLLMLGLLVAITLATFGLACAGFGADLGIAVSCDQPGALGLLRSLFIAVLANQGTYKLSPYSRSRAR